jgi:hypothetical protein
MPGLAHLGPLATQKRNRADPPTLELLRLTLLLLTRLSRSGRPNGRGPTSPLPPPRSPLGPVLGGAPAFRRGGGRRGSMSVIFSRNCAAVRHRRHECGDAARGAVASCAGQPSALDAVTCRGQHQASGQPPQRAAGLHTERLRAAGGHGGDPPARSCARAPAGGPGAAQCGGSPCRLVTSGSTPPQAHASGRAHPLAQVLRGFTRRARVDPQVRPLTPLLCLWGCSCGTCSPAHPPCSLLNQWSRGQLRTRTIVPSSKRLCPAANDCAQQRTIVPSSC